MHRFVRRPLLYGLLAAVVWAGSACNNNTDTTSTSPTTPSTSFTATETFTGALEKNGAQSYSFTVSTIGTVFVTLTTLTDSINPDNVPPTVGISLGTWNGTSCAVNYGIFTDAAGQGAAIAGTVTGAGVLCTRIYDPGSKVSNPVNYTITVTHP